MATKAIPGRKAVVFMNNTSSGTQNSAARIAEVRNWTLTVSESPIDATSNDSSGWEENIDGVKSWNLRAAMANLSTNANQITLVSVFGSTTRKWMTIQPTTAKTQKWQGYVRVVDYDVGGAGPNDLNLRNVTFRGTANLRYTS